MICTFLESHTYLPLVIESIDGSMVGLMLGLLVKFVIDVLEVDSMVVGRHEVMVFMEKTNRINEKMKCFIFSIIQRE